MNGSEPRNAKGLGSKSDSADDINTQRNRVLVPRGLGCQWKLRPGAHREHLPSPAQGRHAVTWGLSLKFSWNNLGFTPGSAECVWAADTPVVIVQCR